MPEDIKEIIEAEIVEDTPDDDTPVAAKAEAEADDEPEQAVDDDTPSDDDEWSEEDMRLLSDEERAALFEDDEGEDTPEVEEVEAKADDAPEVDKPEKAAAAAEERKGTTLPDLATYDAELTTLSDAKTAAFDQWEDGDMTRDEYLAKLKALDTETNAVVKDKAVAETEHKNVYDSFIKTARGYFKDNPDLAVDKVYSENFKYQDQSGAWHPETIARAYDRHVKAVTGSPQYQHMTHSQMLGAAHRLLAAEADVLDIEVPAFKGKAKAKVEVKVDPAPPKPAPRKRPGDDAPKTLANIPAAQATSASDGKYSSIAQRLDSAVGEEYERIWSSMSPDEQEAFASMDV